MTDPRFPVGTFAFAGAVTAERRREWIERVASTPSRLREAVLDLDEAGAELSYRDGGWTIRQVVHHLPDSHMNAFIRLRLALTEDSPTIKPYKESAWAELIDSRTAPVEISVRLLEALHERMVLMLRGMSESDFARTFVHPDQPAPRTLDWLLALYAWHGHHHVAQIEQARARRVRN